MRAFSFCGNFEFFMCEAKQSMCVLVRSPNLSKFFSASKNQSDFSFSSHFDSQRMASDLDVVFRPVALTNSQASKSKLAVVRAGYRADPFADLILADAGDKEVKRSPAVNAGYFARKIALEASFERAITQASILDEPFQVP